MVLTWLIEAGARALASEDGVNETWQNKLVETYEFMGWWGAVICTVLASAFSYYCTCKYTDFMQIARLRSHSGRARGSTSSSHGREGAEGHHQECGSSSDKGREESADYYDGKDNDDDDDASSDTDNVKVVVVDSSTTMEHQQEQEEEEQHGITRTPSRRLLSSQSYRVSSTRAASAIRVMTVKTTSVLLFGLAFITFAVLDFVALAALPLLLVIPVTMLVFVWGTLYRLCFVERHVRFLCTKDFCMALVIVFLIAFAISFGPKGNEKVWIPDIVVWDARAIVYTTIFIFAAIFLHILTLKSDIAAHRAFNWMKLSNRNLVTVIRGVLTGILGGQALVLLKMVAEIVESAIFESDERTFYGTTQFVVIALSLVTTSLHIFSFHHMLSVLDEENASLLLPVHRLAVIVSASIGSTVYLEEWSGVDNVMSVVGYSLSIVGLLCVCVVYAYHAVLVVDGEAYELDHQQSGQIGTFETHDSHEMNFVDSVDGPIELQISNGSHQNHHHQPLPHTNSASGLWGAGMLSPRYGDENEEDGDEECDDDGFFMSHTKTIFAAPFRRRSFIKQRAKNASQGGGKESELTMQDKQAKLNFNFPPATNTMMVKRGTKNPHTDGDDSTWEDPGDLPNQWNIRGPTYLQDREKIDAGRTRMKVVTMEWSYAPNPVPCVSKVADGYIQREHAGKADRPFLFVINFRIPSLGNYVTYYTFKPDIKDSVFDKMVSGFVHAPNDQYRNDRFKLIPGVKEGSYFVRRAVGSKPALLCNKLDTSYHASWDHTKSRIDVRGGGGHWFEVAIDVGSSRVARSIMGAVKGYATGLVLHMGYLIESKATAELPERVLGGIDLYRPAMAPRAGVPLELDFPIENAIEALPDNATLDELAANDAILQFTDGGTETDDDNDDDHDDGYDTEGSFRSVMNLSDEEEDDRITDSLAMEQQPHFKSAVDMNYEYPIPEGTMVMPENVPNPHADPGKSFWIDAGMKEGGWKVRGPQYDQDRVKIPCGEARMKICAFEWLYSPNPPHRHIAARPGGFIEKNHSGQANRPFLFIINFMVPSVGNYVTYLHRKPHIDDPLFDEMLDAFINAEDDAYRNDRLKLIPGVLEGSYFVRKAVGAKPALLCQKLTTSYHRGDNYFEVCIDVGSSIVGARIFSAVKGFASSLTLHLGVVIESKTRRELPERLVTGVDIYTPVMAPRA